MRLFSDGSQKRQTAPEVAEAGRALLNGYEFRKGDHRANHEDRQLGTIVQASLYPPPDGILKAGVWFGGGRLLIVPPDSLVTACPLSGKNSTYRPVQIIEASLKSRQALALDATVPVKSLLVRITANESK